MMDTAILVCDPHRNFLSCSVQTPYSGHFTTSAGNCMRLCRNMTMMACSVVHLTRKKNGPSSPSLSHKHGQEDDIHRHTTGTSVIIFEVPDES